MIISKLTRSLIINGRSNINSNPRRLSCTMKVLLKMPPDMTSVTSAEITKIFIKPGQKVKEGEVVMIIDTAKVVLDENAIVSGEITDVCVKLNQIVENGAP